jgi:hypothetical protein
MGLQGGIRDPARFQRGDSWRCSEEEGGQYRGGGMGILPVSLQRRYELPVSLQRRYGLPVSKEMIRGDVLRKKGGQYRGAV